eukprot:TRINITY_DN15879_c0_g2_i1.p1 TRINITY_DN15879_c0_g2~~TRINITY_DN15879_c0_g2_i1.p1  ORF type:complete len:1105 (-),score=231.86 TRINITY_DN15879_c0_g2_i1:45-3359(-)
MINPATEQVVNHIHGLHTDFANTQAHSAWLQQFQQAPEAFGVVHELLTGKQSEVVYYFAAQTLVTKLQAGNLPNGAACHQEILRYLSHFWSGPAAVTRQLIVALVDYQLWRPAPEDDKWLTDSVQQLSGSADALRCMLELLDVIPVEVINKKVIVDAQRRQSFAANMLRHTATVLDALPRASQANAACSVLALRAFARWLQLQHASTVLRAQKRSAAGAVGGSGPFTADIVKQGTLREHPLLQQAAQVIASSDAANLELYRACGDVLSEAHTLTNEATPQARSILLLVIQAVVAGSKKLLPMVAAASPPGAMEPWLSGEHEVALRLAVIGRLVGELGGVFVRLVLANGRASPADSPQEWIAPLDELSQVALAFCTLRNTDLARCGLDFWYAGLAQHLGAAAEEEDPFDDDAGPVGAGSGSSGRGGASDGWSQPRSADQERQRRAEEQPFLAPHIQNMVKALWRAVRYPAEPEREEYFEWDDFVRFRETCSVNITEACVVVTPQWIIEHIGSILEDICSRQPIAWQDIDACVFVLTGVASRAPAGQDTVIPKLIELLPDLPYPTEGFKAMLLRSAASRLVLFTSGYLALNPEPCKHIVKFLILKHLPAIPPLTVAPDPDAKKYCEALACDAMKMVMTAARKTIVAADNGAFWKEVVTGVIGILGSAPFNVDCRAQLVFGIGQVLSVLSDWRELEQMLGLFVSKMQEPLAPLLAQLPAEPLGSRAVKTTRDGKAPSELKLYVAAVSSVYNIPAPKETMQLPDHHPVLAVVEQALPMVELLCIHHTQYEDFMEQVCLAFSYILGFAREYAPDSPVFVPMMKLMARCCEQHPQPFYMGLVRSVVGFFAATGNDQLDAVLVDLTGLFVAPLARRLASAALSGNGHGANGNGAGALPPPLNAAAFEMLAETLRHWNLALLAFKSAPWLTEVLDSALDLIPRLAEENQAIHEKTVCAMLRFLRNVLLWADQETYKQDPSPILQEVQQQAQALIGDRPLPHGVALPRIISALALLLAATAPNAPGKGEVVPCVAEVLRTLFTGPFVYVASSQLPTTLRALPRPLGELLTDSDLQRLVQQLKMEKGDSRRFAKTVVGLAEQFAVSLKKAQYGG